MTAALEVPEAMNTILASIPSPSDNVIEVGPLTIHYYGILIAIGVIVAVLVTKRRYVRFGGDGGLVERVSIWAVVIGFLGARLGYAITHSGDYFPDRPWAVFFIWEGGLALYGGLLGGAITAIYLMHRWRGDAFAFGDGVAIGIPLAQVIGRLGNYFNQELFGTPTTLPWGLEIDPSRRPAGYETFETFHPTFLYEGLWNLVITVGLILLLERRGKLYKGAAFPLYLILYGTGRFLMELLRTDTTFRVFGVSRNGWVSVLAIVVGVIAFVWMQRRREPQGVAPWALAGAATDEDSDEVVDEEPPDAGEEDSGDLADATSEDEDSPAEPIDG
jgi:prolipoprotein diacylglyceryl transferase